MSGSTWYDLLCFPELFLVCIALSEMKSLSDQTGHLEVSNQLAEESPISRLVYHTYTTYQDI